MEKGVFLGLIFGILLVSGIVFVLAEENITCSSNSECGELSTSFAFCKNESTICTATTTPTCNNATTNVSSCEDVRVEDCWPCDGKCESGFCVDVEPEPVCDSDNLDLCLNETDCIDASAYWYNETCNDEEEDDDEGPSKNKTNGNQGLGQIIRGRVKAGVYTDEAGNEIRVSELAKNRTKFEFGGIEAETELEIEEETEGNKTKLKVKLKNGRDVEIKIMPNVASQTALEKLKIKVCSVDNNCTIELKEVGDKLTYEIQAERHASILAMFRAKMQVKAEVDAETGELIRVKKPWWAFLALESEE